MSKIYDVYKVTVSFVIEAPRNMSEETIKKELNTGVECGIDDSTTIYSVTTPDTNFLDPIKIERINQP